MKINPSFINYNNFYQMIKKYDTISIKYSEKGDEVHEKNIIYDRFIL